MNTRTPVKLSIAGFLSLAVAAAAQAGSDARPSGASRMVVAIEKFENKSTAPDRALDTIRSRVQQCVVGARKYEVVERERFNTALSEQKLAASGYTNGDDPDAPAAGKMKAAGYIIYGTVLYCGEEKAGGSFEGVASSVAKTKVELQIKITDGETGRILAQKSAIGCGVDKATATSDFSTATSAGKGMRDAIDEACHMAADALREVSYPAKIVLVNDEDVIINMTGEEVKEGDLFDVVDAKDLGIDDVTGEWLGYGGRTIGRIKVETTGAKTSNAEPAKDKKGRTLDLESLDTATHLYILRRVSKETLRKEARKASQEKRSGFERRF